MNKLLFDTFLLDMDTGMAFSPKSRDLPVSVGCGRVELDINITQTLGTGNSISSLKAELEDK